MDFVFNRNALEINSAGEGAYFIRVNGIVEKRGLIDLLKQYLIHSDDDEDYQNLFKHWHGFMF